MNRLFHIVLEYDKEENVYITHVPALDNISTFGTTRGEALDNTREAILGYIEAAQKEGLPLPGEDNALEWIDLEIAV